MRLLPKILFSACICFLIQSTTTAQTLSLVYDNADSTVELIKKYVAGYDAGDFDAITSVFAPDADIYLEDGEKVTLQEFKDQVVELLSNYTCVTSDTVYLPIKGADSPLAGEYVFIWGTITSTTKESGTVIPIPYHIATVVENNKIVTFRRYFDNRHIMQKLGYTITPPAGN